MVFKIDCWKERNDHHFEHQVKFIVIENPTEHLGPSILSVSSL